ncbi:MAG: phytanoyl-CoA dioxygenase family protein [Massilia sp.]
MNRFQQDGYAVIAQLLTASECATISAALAGTADPSIGSRNLLDLPWCKALAHTLGSHPAIASHLPQEARAVQCTYFEKSQDQNWLVPIHQDLSIPVQERIAHERLSGWSVKEGGMFVHAPEAVLAELVAVRLHIDDCGIDDGPLKVVPGSHLAGKLSNASALAKRDQLGEHACPVVQGGALLLRPLLLHASSKASGSSRRRVLHFVFGPKELPFGLRWQHAV